MDCPAGIFVGNCMVIQLRYVARLIDTPRPRCHHANSATAAGNNEHSAHVRSLVAVANVNYIAWYSVKVSARLVILAFVASTAAS